MTLRRGTSLRCVLRRKLLAGILGWLDDAFPFEDAWNDGRAQHHRRPDRKPRCVAAVGVLFVNATLDRLIGRVDTLETTVTTHVSSPGLHR